MITCNVCQSTTVTHYKQQRRDGVWVVTARCENGHIPEKGKPFYPISQFDIHALPVLGSDEPQGVQPELFVEPKRPPVVTREATDLIAEKRKLFERFRKDFSHD